MGRQPFPVVKRDLASAVRDLMRSRGLTQRALAVRLGVTEGRVSHMMHGNLTVRSLWRLADALGCDLRVSFGARTRRTP